MSKKCFLCGREKDIIDFDKNSFKRCHSKLAFRKKQNFKYGDIQLRKESLDFVGYHSTCYNKVTALKQKYKEEFEKFLKNYELPTTSRSLNSSDNDPLEITALEYDENNTEDLYEMPSTSTSSTYAGQVVCCIFCNKKQKKSGKRVLNVIISSSNELSEKMKNVAESLGDHEFLLKLKNLPIAYHNTCYASFLTKEKRSHDHHSDSSWHYYRNLHKEAFECIADFISNEIIDNNRVMHFSQLFLRYQALLLEFGNNTIDLVDIEDYRPEMLEKKVFKKFGDTLIIEASNGPRNEKIIYKADIDISAMANNTTFLERKNEEKFDDVSFQLRNCIKTIELKPLPKLTAEDVIRGECEIPPLLFDFMCNLIKGPHFSEKNSTQATTQVISICSDIIEAVTKGACEPAKN